MDIRKIESIQRVVNFTLDDGKMIQAEHKGAIIPGVRMICDLPLLFTNGLPTCLENLTASQLKTFVPYMIKCSGSLQTKPKWWPNEIDFSATPEKTSDMTEEQWLLFLKRLVSNCYSYHGCEFALRLCADPFHKCHSSEWTVRHGSADTVPQYKVTRQRLAASRNANVMYCNGRPIPEKSLVAKSVNNISKKKANYETMQKTKSPVQVYLCDTCDSEFSSSRDMQNHEKTCFQNNCKSPALRVSVNKIPVPSYNSILTSNSESNIHDGSVRIPRSQCSSLGTKTQTARKTLVSRNSRTTATQKTASYAKETTQHGHTSRSSENVLSSSKQMRDREASYPKQQLVQSPHFPSLNAGRSRSNNNGLLSPQIILQDIRTSQATKNSRNKKKKMSLMSSKQDYDTSVNSLPQSEVFLCDNCDREFTSFTDIQQHNTLCCKVRRELIPSPIVFVELELTQGNFLNYFELFPASHSRSSSYTMSTSAQRSKRFFGNPMRYSAIPISSMLGSLIHGFQVPVAAVLNKREKVERYCSTKSIDVFTVQEEHDVDAWRVSWKKRKIENENSTHTYSYPVKQWWKMPLLWKARMKVKERNRRLMTLCKPLRVKIKKLTAREIEFYTTCRTAIPKVKKLTSEEICVYTKSCSVTPKLRRLSSQEIEVYTGQCSIAPKVRRLSVQEIEKHVKQ